MLQPVAMSCDLASPWGDIRFEARWQKVRAGLEAAGAGTSQSSRGGGRNGGPFWGPCAQMPASVAMSLQR